MEEGGGGGGIKHVWVQTYNESFLMRESICQATQLQYTVVLLGSEKIVRLNTYLSRK